MRMVIFCLMLCSGIAFAEEAQQPPTMGSQEFNDPLKVKGQTRRLNMLLNLRGQGDDIKFIRLRKDYRKEILRTQY